MTRMICTRPEWSTPDNDYCMCDDACMYKDIMEAGENPCEYCTYWEEKT